MESEVLPRTPKLLMFVKPQCHGVTLGSFHQTSGHWCYSRESLAELSSSFPLRLERCSHFARYYQIPRVKRGFNTGAGRQKLLQRFIHDISLSLHLVLRTNKWLTLPVSLPPQESALKLHVRNKTLPSIKWTSHRWINKLLLLSPLPFWHLCIFHNSLWQVISIFFTSFAYKSTFFQQQWICHLWLSLCIIVFLSCGTRKIELPPGLRPDNSLFLHIFNHFPSCSSLFRKHYLHKKKSNLVHCCTTTKPRFQGCWKAKSLFLPLNLLQRL